VHSLSENNTIFYLTNLLHENTEKILSLFCFLTMKLFSEISVVEKIAQFRYNFQQNMGQRGDSRIF
jgi:hypothetical protein